MGMIEEIEKGKQMIARCEKSLAHEKLKQRRVDTRRKIEFGGLVIKSGLDQYNKFIILGALKYSLDSIQKDSKNLTLYEKIGKNLFVK